MAFSGVVLSTSSVLCDHHLCLVPRHFHPPNGTPCPRAVTALPPHQLAAANLLPGSVALPLESISHKWNRTGGLWCLTPSTPQLSRPTRAAACRCPFPFKAEGQSVVRICSSADGRLGCCHPLARANGAAVSGAWSSCLCPLPVPAPGVVHRLRTQPALLLHRV